MQKRPELTVVILSFNTKSLILECIDSIKKTALNVNYDLVVADNGSTDGSQAAFERLNIKVIENRKNLGFAKGNNVVLRRVRSKYVLLLNPDTVVHTGTVKGCLDYLKENPSVGAVSCRVELPDGTLDYSCHRGFPTPWNALCYFSGLARLFPKVKLFAGYTMTYQNIDQIHEIDALTGAFAMIRTEAGKQVGWLDEDYFWNGEDIDFCWMLKERGWKIMYLPTAKILHYKGSTSGLRKSGKGSVDFHTKQQAALSSTAVMRLFYKKHLEQRYPWLVNRLVYLGIYLLERTRVAKL